MGTFDKNDEVACKFLITDARARDIIDETVEKDLLNLLERYTF